MLLVGKVRQLCVGRPGARDLTDNCGYVGEKCGKRIPEDGVSLRAHRTGAPGRNAPCPTHGAGFSCFGHQEITKVPKRRWFGV
jgi:hypothetical protein